MDEARNLPTWALAHGGLSQYFTVLRSATRPGEKWVRVEAVDPVDTPMDKLLGRIGSTWYARTEDNHG